MKHKLFNCVRKNIRRPDHDYSRGGLYFVTMCTNGRFCLFGNIHEEKMTFNDAGQMINNSWLAINDLYEGVSIFDFQVMPNHLHGILSVSADYEIESSVSLGKIIRRLKSYTTLKYINGVRNKNWEPFNRKLWQRGYYDRIIRTPEEFDRIKKYIQTNPKDWERDKFNPTYK